MLIKPITCFIMNPNKILRFDVLLFSDHLLVSKLVLLLSYSLESRHCPLSWFLSLVLVYLYILSTTVAEDLDVWVSIIILP
jgi:hypothetical protein